MKRTFLVTFPSVALLAISFLIAFPTEHDRKPVWRVLATFAENDGPDNDGDGFVDGDDGDAVLTEYCYDGDHDGRCDEDGDGFGIGTVRLCVLDEASTIASATGGDPKLVLNFIRVPEIRDAVVTCYVDLDNDGYGDSADAVYESTGHCADPDRVTRDGDCDDMNASVHPSAYDSEHDSADGNCDGSP